MQVALMPMTTVAVVSPVLSSLSFRLLGFGIVGDDPCQRSFESIEMLLG